MAAKKKKTTKQKKEDIRSQLPKGMNRNQKKLFIMLDEAERPRRKKR